MSTAANEADATQADHLLQRDEDWLFADGGYTGVGHRIDADVAWHIAAKHGKIKQLAETARPDGRWNDSRNSKPACARKSTVHFASGDDALAQQTLNAWLER